MSELAMKSMMNIIMNTSWVMVMDIKMHDLLHILMTFAYFQRIS